MEVLLLLFKIAYTLFILYLIPVYWKHYGPGNFLWFSDIALFGTCLALWLESGLLGSMMALAVLIPETGWNLDYFVRLTTGKRLIGLSDYMFEEDKPVFLRRLSLFHVVIPAVLIYLLIAHGYNEEAIFWQTLLAWIVLPVTYLVTPPKENINWVYGPGSKPQKKVHPVAYLILLMAFFPVFIYLPTHFLIKWIFDL